MRLPERPLRFPLITFPKAKEMDDFVSEAADAAISRISDLLKHPDDLTNKFSALKKKLMLERANIDAQLKTAGLHFHMNFTF